MRVRRSVLFVAFTIAAVSLATPRPTHGQATPPAAGSLAAELKLYTKIVESDPATGNRIRDMMSTKLRIIGGPDEKLNRAALTRFAEHYVYKITQEKYYASGAESGELKGRSQEYTIDAVFRDLDNYLLKPDVDTVKKMNVDHAEYIKYFGEALDKTITPLLKVPQPLIRVNAARLLAQVSATGAPVHAKTITQLLKDPKTPPEVLLYAYKAAEGLLSAYDPLAVGRLDPNRHTVPLEDLVPLIQALESHILTNPPVADKVALPAPPPAPKVAAGNEPAAPAVAPPVEATGRLDPKTLKPEQIAVVQYFRRAAIRALAKVRFDILGGKPGVPEVRPALTLARVAVNDAVMSPDVTYTEQAEAVIGLCSLNISPSMNVDELCQAIGIGVVGFGRVKNQDAADRTIPWRIYGAKLNAALAEFRSSVRKNPRALKFQTLIIGISKVIQDEVVNRLDGGAGGAVGAGPNVEALIAWMQQNPTQPQNNQQLFDNQPASKLAPRLK